MSTTMLEMEGFYIRRQILHPGTLTIWVCIFSEVLMQVHHEAVLTNLTGRSPSLLNKLSRPTVQVLHYDDVTMSGMASQITSPGIVYSTVYPGADQRKHKAPRHWPLCGEFTGGEFPALMASNAETVSIWWRHHEVHRPRYVIFSCG